MGRRCEDITTKFQVIPDVRDGGRKQSRVRLRPGEDMGPRTKNRTDFVPPNNNVINSDTGQRPRDKDDDLD